MNSDLSYERTREIVARVLLITLMGVGAFYLVASKINNLRRPYQPPRPYGYELTEKPESRPSDLELKVNENK